MQTCKDTVPDTEYFALCSAQQNRVLHITEHSTGPTFRYIACLYILRTLSRERRPRTLPCAPRAPVLPQCNPHSCLAPRTELHAPPRSAAVVYYSAVLAHFLFETLLLLPVPIHLINPTSPAGYNLSAMLRPGAAPNSDSTWHPALWRQQMPSPWTWQLMQSSNRGTHEKSLGIFVHTVNSPCDTLAQR